MGSGLGQRMVYGDCVDKTKDGWVNHEGRLCDWTRTEESVDKVPRVKERRYWERT